MKSLEYIERKLEWLITGGSRQLDQDEEIKNLEQVKSDLERLEKLEDRADKMINKINKLEERTGNLQEENANLRDKLNTEEYCYVSLETQFKKYKNVFKILKKGIFLDNFKDNHYVQFEDKVLPLSKKEKELFEEVFGE